MARQDEDGETRAGRPGSERKGLQYRVTAVAGALTLAVVLLLVLCFGLLLRTITEQRTIAGVRAEADKVAMVAAASPRGPARGAAPADFGTDRGTGTTIRWPGGHAIGEVTNDPAMTRAQEGEGFVERNAGRAVVYATSAGDKGVVVVRMVVPPGELHRGVWPLTALLGAFGLSLLVVTVWATYKISGVLVTRPVRRLVDAADALQEGRLETRTPEKGPGELVALAGSLNKLGGRITDLLMMEREAVADLSHRLRTPITALRLDADSIPDPETANRMRRHVTSLERTVDAVLREARRPARSDGSSRCDATEVVANRVVFWSALADEQRRYLRVELPRGPTQVRLDRGELTDIVDALIDNIFAYTPEGVSMEVSLQVTRQHAALRVEDGGPGLPADHVVTRGQSSGTGSSGLGLDIARRAAIASGGSLEFGASRLGGTQVTVLLGLAEADRAKRFGTERLRRDMLGTERLRRRKQIRGRLVSGRLVPARLTPAMGIRLKPPTPKPPRSR